MKVAVVIPVFNEVRWVTHAVERLSATPPPRAGEGADRDPPCERSIILVDDGSSDGTTEIVKHLGAQGLVTPVLYGPNRGKGFAVRAGIAKALELGADVVLIHDADLEYDPRDHDAALRPILDGRADAVIGSRFIGHTHRVLYFWHFAANRLITTCCNIATNLNLTDVECCTKAFASPVLKGLALTEDRFGIEIELIAKAARLRLPRDGTTPSPVRVYEVAVGYAGRTYEEGKKITWHDGAAALWCILKHGVLRA